MAARRNRKHLLVRSPPTAEPYTPHRRGIIPKAVPAPPDRGRHAKILGDSLRSAEAQAAASRNALNLSIHGAKPGLYIQFDGWPGIDLKLESLEDARSGIELVTVKIEGSPNEAA